MARSRGYDALSVTPENTALLDRILGHIQAGGPEHVAVFDLDGCLFDTRPRQVRIFRELAARRGFEPLFRVDAEHFRDWSLRRTLLAAGIDGEWIQAHGPEIRAWWEERFFTSAYVVYDHPMPGATALVRAVWESGAEVVYLTGRDVTMAAGTEVALRSYGFPYDIERTSLMVKPEADIDDTTFKAEAIERIDAMGRVVLYLDNEPANVNLFRRRHPEALVVFVETDHSPRPDEPDVEIPWLRSFYRG